MKKVMDVFNLLFGTLGREWCIIFRVIVIFTGISFFSVLLVFVWDILKGRSVLFNPFRWNILAISFLGYITSRLYLTMCVR